MAKYTTKSKYVQTTKGNKREARQFAKQGGVLRRLAKINESKLKNLGNQYQTSLGDIKAKTLRDSAILAGAQTAAGENYAKLGADNDAAESDTSFANLANQRRERTQGLAQVQALGGGETDMLKAQGAALRNWSQNQSQTARSFADTLTSINNNVSDTNQQNLAAFHNLSEQADTDARAAFNQYKEAQGQVYNEQADLYGQQANLYGDASSAAATNTATNTAKESSKGGKNKTLKTNSTQTQGSKETRLSRRYTKEQDRANTGLLKNAQEIADLNKQTYQGTRMSTDELGYSAIAEQEGVQNTNDLANAQKLTKITGVQGATLRKW